MLNKRILASTCALLLGGSLFGQIAIKEEATKKVENAIKVDGPADAGALQKRNKSDDIKFISGDYFKGNLISIGAKGLTWKHPEASADILFKTKNLDVINFGHIPVSNRRNGVSDITLTNEDRLFGVITEMNDESLILDTWYGGTIKLERAMIKAISAGGSINKAIYEGPTNISEWTLNNSRGWEVKDNALVSKRSYSSVGKDIKIPEKSNIEFDVAWNSRLRMTVSFYASRLRNSSGNSYQLEFNDSYCYVNRYSDNEGQDRLGSSFRLKDLKTKFRVSIRTDKEKKQILVLIDGKVVYSTSDSDEFVSNGTGLVFYTQQGNVKVSNITVTEWSGGTGSVVNAKAKSKDSIVFVNKDTVTGTLKSIKKGKVIFETPFAPLTIPIDRISSIVLGEEGYEKPRRNAQDVELFFAGGAGRLTLKLKDIEKAKISGSSENYGDAKFNLLAFEKLIFNIYNEKKNKSDSDSEDW